MARTHTELYRRFEGELSSRRLRFLPLVASGVRTAKKKKLPLLILYAPVVITTIIFSFVVYGKYATADLAKTVGGTQGLIAMFAQKAALDIDVAEKVMQANDALRMFALLAIAWFGSGLLAEDRRLGAHLLYFARPLTRLDYFLGKFLTMATFAAYACLVPGLVICLFAAWCSPNWSFLRNESDVLWKSLAYSCIWITVTGSIVLCVSSLVKRKTLALAGSFGFFIINHAFAGVVGQIDTNYRALSVLQDLDRVGNWMFGIHDPWRAPFPIQNAFLVLAGVTALALGVLAWRLRKLEIVA